MDEMKVCKFVRLTSKDPKGKFVNSKDGRTTIRTKVVVSEDTVKETEANFETTGLLYIVDEAKTKERNAVVEAENAGTEEVENKGTEAGAKL